MHLPPTTTAEVARIADPAIQTAPWWGVPTVAGLFLIIGGVLSFLSTNLSDKRKALQAEESTKRAQELQHRKELQAAAAAFLVESRNVFEAFKATS